MEQMHSRAIVITLLLTLFTNYSYSQRRADKKIIKRLKADIEYLASDALEGRRTGSEGELKAADYIEARYVREKIDPFKEQYKIPFQFVYGKEIDAATKITIGGRELDRTEAFPLPFSPNTSETLTSDVLPDVFEHGTIWLIALYADRNEADDAHFDYEKLIYDRAKEARKQGASAVIFYDNLKAKYPPVFNTHSNMDPVDIPVAFLTNTAFEAYVSNREEGVPVSMTLRVRKTEYTGTNVAAFIDNKAPYTVVIGAHYDHLGFGHDGSSLYTGKDKQIHNGADDNASGTAGLMELASRIKKRKLRNYNYLFIHFSGEELGLLGSKAFVKDMHLDSSKVAYMINMDMIGRLNDSTHALTVGGIGTSPVWPTFVNTVNKNFRFVVDSSGVGPSDHTSFYHAGIPVLFLFTGIHHDYHKPTDDAEKVNYYGEVKVLEYAYSIVDVMDTRLKPAFTPTKQSTVGKVRFKVTLGIMPDYSFQNEGVRVDGVSEGKPAIKAGIRAGDIITRLGEYPVLGMQSYMEALGKFKAGQTVEVTLLRDGQPVVLTLTF